MLPNSITDETTVKTKYEWNMDLWAKAEAVGRYEEQISKSQNLLPCKHHGRNPTLGIQFTLTLQFLSSLSH